MCVRARFYCTLQNNMKTPFTPSTHNRENDDKMKWNGKIVLVFALSSETSHRLPIAFCCAELCRVIEKQKNEEKKLR